MLRSCINGPDDRAQIYGGQVFPDPPTILSLTEGGGGGGPESLIRPMHIWTVQDQVLRSTINIRFWTPPFVLPLMEGGGPECVINRAHRSAAQKKVHRSTTQDIFWTLPNDLPLTEGGGSGMVFFLWRAHLYMWQRSNGYESHHLLLSDRPPSPLDVTTHLSRNSHVQ
jgi:hypothetical protein